MLYERDRAARDIGLHFTQMKASGEKIVTTALAWFQLKGIRDIALSKANYDQAETIAIELEVKHLRFWHGLPVPTYLGLYIEAADEFLVMNVSRWIEQEFGEAIFQDSATTRTMRVPKASVLNKSAFDAIRITASVDLIRKRLTLDELGALLFLRDAQILKSVATSSERAVEQRLVWRRWISKMRSEVNFEERSDEAAEWEEIRRHWEYAMGPLEEAFPYLTFEAYDEEMDWDNVWDPDEIDPEDIHEIGGKMFIGEGGSSGECSEIELRPGLNDLGHTWSKMLAILEQADLLIVDDQTRWISVAPWHGPSL